MTPERVPSYEEAVQLILTHPDPERREYWACLMLHLLDTRPGRVSAEKRAEYQRLLSPHAPRTLELEERTDKFQPINEGENVRLLRSLVVDAIKKGVLKDDKALELIIFLDRL